MSNLGTNYDRALNAISYAKSLGILQLKVSSDHYDGRIVRVEGKDLIHFGNCSYVGLDTCEAIKQGAIDAITRYGNLFANSRLNIGLDLNEKLEDLLDQITGHHTLITQSTTLASLSAIPIITSPDDLILLDHQVHASVQNAVKIAQTQGTQANMIRHNDMAALEENIKKHQRNYKKIWYMADGLYSMIGDPCPIEDIHQLMDKYPHFHCFVDDAHGISWIGEHGKGFTLHKKPLHRQMVLAMSMAKGFGCCGGILVFPTAEARHRIRCLGSSLIYSGPIPTPVLGGCIASAKLHLTDEIKERQKSLHDRINFFSQLALSLGLPVVNKNFSPIFYFGVGSEENAILVVKKMIEEGYFTTISSYPVVPKKQVGMRMSITTHLTFEDIEKALWTLASIFNDLENKGKFDKELVYKSFSAFEAA